VLAPVGEAHQDALAADLRQPRPAHRRELDPGRAAPAAHDLHVPELPEEWSPAIATGIGLPIWTNHIAFGATDLDDLARRRTRWLDHGVDVMEVDHGWCTSIYATDPNGIMVEFCASTREFSEADRKDALRLLESEEAVLGDPPPTKIHRAKDHVRP
jgi:hypothetical protein